MDREEVLRLVGTQVTVVLENAETHGLEVLATLESVGDAGVTLSGIGELCPGPTLFCPWDSLKRVRARGAGPAPPDVSGRDYPEWDPPTDWELEEPAERRPEPSAWTLERVVSKARREKVGEITVALTSLELFERGPGVLRWRVSLTEDAPGDDESHYGGMAHPAFIIRDTAGRTLSWSHRSSGSGGGESDGEIEVENLPSEGEISVEIPFLTSKPWRKSLADRTYDGPWSFSFEV